MKFTLISQTKLKQPRIASGVLKKKCWSAKKCWKQKEELWEVKIRISRLKSGSFNTHYSSKEFSLRRRMRTGNRKRSSSNKHGRKKFQSFGVSIKTKSQRVRICVQDKRVTSKTKKVCRTNFAKLRCRCSAKTRHQRNWRAQLGACSPWRLLNSTLLNSCRRIEKIVGLCSWLF